MAINYQIGNYVKFLRGTPNAYSQLALKDPDTLYFISEDNADKGVLYLGDKLISGSLTASISLSDLNDVIIAAGIEPGSLLYYDGSRWVNKSLSEILEVIVGVMRGATDTTDGRSGLVPTPVAGQQGLYLRGDGLWANPTHVLEQQVNIITGQVGTLINNDVNKSIRQIASEEVQKIVDGAPAALDTLNEIATYILDHPTEGNLVTRVQNLETTVDTPGSGLKDQLAAVRVNVLNLQNDFIDIDDRVTNVENALKWQKFYVE